MTRAFQFLAPFLFVLLLTPGPSARAQSPSPKAAEKSAPPAKPPAKTEAAKPSAPPAAASTAAAGTTGVQKMAGDFNQQREARLDDRRALLEKLRLAKSDEEKQRVLTELRQQQQQRLDEQREAARQAREQLRETRK